MKKVSLGGSGQFLAPGDFEKVRGVYLETRESTSGKFPQKLHTVETEESGTVILNGNGQLDSFFAKVKTGTTVEVHYLGKQEITKGKWKGSMAHTYEFFVDDDAAVNTPEPDETPAAAPVAAGEPKRKVF